MEYQKYLIRSALADIFSGPNPFSKESPSNDKNEEDSKELGFMEKVKKENTVIEKNIGDEVELATFKVKVLEVQEMKVVNRSFGSPVVAPEGSKYVVLKVELTNLTKETFKYDGSGALVDQQERVFTRELVGGSNEILYDDLKPSIKVSGNLFHIMPEDASSYNWVMLKAGTNEAYRIKLK